MPSVTLVYPDLTTYAVSDNTSWLIELIESEFQVTHIDFSCLELLVVGRV